MGILSICVFLLVISFCVASGTYGTTCTHGELMEHIQSLGNHQMPPVHQNHKLPESSTFLADPPPLFTQPMRIRVNLDNIYDDPKACYKPGDVVPVRNTSHLCRDSDILTQQKVTTLMSLLQEATLFFKNVLLVIPTKNDRLIINSSATEQSFCDGVRIDPSYEFEGVPESEYVLFVTTRPAPTDTTLAYARYCQIDDLGRPIVGIVNFAPHSIDVSPEANVRQIGVIVHEITHALGFSFSQFQIGFIKWNWNGNSWVYSRVPTQQILKTDDYPGIGHTVIRVMTPAVRDAARRHFGCDSLDGAELEDGGGAGTAYSHWEQRVFRNEYMTGTSTPFPAYSNITFSLFKDMGWYDVQHNNTYTQNLDPFLWGKNMGCDFVNGDCKKWPLTGENEGYRCTEESPKGQCRFDMRGWAQCNIPFQNVLDDGCNFYESSSRTSCQYDTKFLRMTMDAGEYHGSHSKCFHSSLARFPSLLNSFFRSPQASTMQCYATSCSSLTKAKVGVEGVWYDCPYEGGEIYPINFGGSIHCNPRVADVLCSNANEDDDSWPTVTKVIPRKTTPGSVITVAGTNFKQNITKTKLNSVPCENIVLSETEMQVTVPSEEQFSSVEILGLFYGRFSVIVEDDQGRNAHLKDSVIVSISPKGSSTHAFLSRNGLSVVVSNIIAGVICLIWLCGCVGYCWKVVPTFERKYVYNSVNIS
eukprot:TRINITY_DN11441_c0_g1_i1.p1 TRINITY_DN11441_c0_g1~~TRINITY_DN11441_c0_g1_i1.p1  ORF type:complete len:699 (-),score=100.41 TRINITY_DN11441_c0_g1_i1:18-2114(-)